MQNVEIKLEAMKCSMAIHGHGMTTAGVEKSTPADVLDTAENIYRWFIETPKKKKKARG